MSFPVELWGFISRRKLWLLPILAMALIFVGLAVVTRPFLYQPEILEWLNRPASNVR